MAPPPRVKLALDSMSAIGFSRKLSTPVLKKLLTVYDDNFNYIEENGYQLLIDSILDEQEKMAAVVKNENRAADENCEQSRKRVINTHETTASPSKHYSENFGEFTLKKPKLEPGLDVHNNHISGYLSKAKNVEASDEMPIPLVVIPLPQQNQNANEDLNRNLNQVNSSSRSTPVLEANDNMPLPTGSTTPHLDTVSGIQAANTSPENGKASEFATSQKASSATLEVASSDREGVKLLLSLNSNLVMPGLDTIIKIMEEKCLKSYKLLDPEFSLKQILKDICQCTSELILENITSEQENAAKLSCDKESKDAQVKKENDVEGEEIKEWKNINYSPLSSQLFNSEIKPRHDHVDISKGAEGVKISFVNEFTSDEAPSFYYIRENIVYQNAYVNLSLARVGDEDCCSSCFGDCATAPTTCPCVRATGGEFAYTHDGLLKLDFLDECMSINSKPQKQHHVYCLDCPLERSKKSNASNKCKGHVVRKFIKECWRKCGCNKKCTNRVVQRGISRKLQVFFTPEGKGWGLQTLEKLPRGAFVCEYIGEILTNMELHDRTIQSNASSKHTHPVLLDSDWGCERLLKDDKALSLDATFYGNVVRFVNHRCVDANMVGIPVEIETPDRHYYHLAFFTTRKVEPLEELTRDYGVDFDDVNHPIEAFKCRCGSKFCKDTK